MANHQPAAFEQQPMWAGGRSPFNVSYGKLMMWLFLLSDVRRRRNVTAPALAWRLSGRLVQRRCAWLSNMNTHPRMCAHPSRARSRLPSVNCEGLAAYSAADHDQHCDEQHLCS